MKDKTKKISKKKKTLILVILGALILIGAAVYTLVIEPKLSEDKIEYEEVTVEKGDLTKVVTESGSLQYVINSVNYNLNLDVSDDDDDDDDDEEEEETTVRYLRIESIMKVPGEAVNEGDGLIKFTDSSIESVRRLLKSALVEAQADLNDAESEYELALLEAETTYSTSGITAKYAETIYKNSTKYISNNISRLELEIQNRQNKVASLQEDIDEAQEDYNDALKEYTQAKSNYEACDMGNMNNYMVFFTGYLNAKSAFERAETALDNAKTALSDNEKSINSLKSELTQAKKAKTVDKIAVEQTYKENVITGENAAIVLEAKKESLLEDLKEAQETLEGREEQLQKFEEFVGTEGIIYAPATGLVTAVNCEEGDTLEEEKSLINYIVSDEMTVSADVTEEDVVAISVGDKVVVEFNAYEGETFNGYIESINTTSTSSGTNTVSYQVVVHVEGTVDKLFGGMSANIIFTTDVRENVLYVPRKTIVTQNGRNYVYVYNFGSGYTLTEVTTGLTNSQYCEICSGLNEGDTVYIERRIKASSGKEQADEN